MPYEITALLDEVPKGRTRKPHGDKYQELKELLDQIPQGKTAEVPLEKSRYRAFSAGIRAAGVQVRKKAEATYKGGSAWVSWAPLTAENMPKRRGGRRRNETAPVPTVAPTPAPVEEAAPPKRPGRPRKAAVAS